MKPWHLGWMAAFDTESTDSDPTTARIVTACVSWVDGSGKSKPVTRTWLADPGVPSKPDALRVHGLVAEHYGVKAGKAHDAAGDAMTAARVAWKIADKHPHIANMPLADLQEWQAKKKREQAASLAEHFIKTGKPQPVDGSWPLKPWTGEGS